MYEIGDHVIYGRSGICLVKDISCLKLRGISDTQLYYTLAPVYTTETIFAPVDTAMPMRPAISHHEAVNLIAQIPEIEKAMEIPVNMDHKELAKYYAELLKSHDCKDLIKLIIASYIRGEKSSREKLKISQTDKSFRRDAENILYGELSIALGISKKSIPDFIGDALQSQKSNQAWSKEDSKDEFIKKASNA